MKITNIRTVQPVAPNSPPDWRTSMGQILVAVDTDSGLTGYGVGGGGEAGMHVVRTVLRDLLLDKDPDEIELHWESMYKATLPFGRKGLAIMAISGVDLALWDLRGKANKVPVVELLGGRPGNPIPTYTTIWKDVTPEEAEDHSAFKLHVEGTDRSETVDRVTERVKANRTAIGPNKALMIDAWMRWDIPTTLEVASAIERYDVGWIEEPIPADNLAGYEQLTQRCPIPVAGGEHEFTSAAFKEIIDRNLHAVLQPDVCWCGGLTELIRIYNMAGAANVRVCPHRGAELWALHAIAALDPSPLAESGRTWMEWVGNQPPIQNGTITLGDAPGLGVTIDEASLPGV